MKAYRQTLIIECFFSVVS